MHRLNISVVIGAKQDQTGSLPASDRKWLLALSLSLCTRVKTKKGQETDSALESEEELKKKSFKILARSSNTTL